MVAQPREGRPQGLRLRGARHTTLGRGADLQARPRAHKHLLHRHPAGFDHHTHGADDTGVALLDVHRGDARTQAILKVEGHRIDGVAHVQERRHSHRLVGAVHPRGGVSLHEAGVGLQVRHVQHLRIPWNLDVVGTADRSDATALDHDHPVGDGLAGKGVDGSGPHRIFLTRFRLGREQEAASEEAQGEGQVSLSDPLKKACWLLDHREEVVWVSTEEGVFGELKGVVSVGRRRSHRRSQHP